MSMSSVAVQRLRKDAARLAKDPVPYVTAVPLPANILEWHYVVEGPSDSPYAGGVYHGKLIFPREYPFKPPSIYMLTPNGRFQVNTRLCLSISDFHPDTWNPAWSVGTILTGLLSFMLETTPTLGSIDTSDYERRQLARLSVVHNLKSKLFRELFPDLCMKLQTELDKAQCKDKLAGPHLASQIDDNSPTGVDQNDTNHNTGSILNNSTVSNLLVFVGVVAFVFVAKYVLQSAE